MAHSNKIERSTLARKGGTSLFIPNNLLNRLEEGAEKKGYVNWSEYARTLLVKGLDEDEKGPIDRTKRSD